MELVCKKYSIPKLDNGSLQIEVGRGRGRGGDGSLQIDL